MCRWNNSNSTNQGGQSHRCLRIQEWCDSTSSFSLFLEHPHKFAPQFPLYVPNCFFSCRKSRKKKKEGGGGEQRLRRQTKSQMVESTMKGKREPKRPFGEHHFRAPRTEEIRWYHFKCYPTMNESSESHFWLSLGIKAKSCATANRSIFCQAKLQITASLPGMSLLEGTMRHRFLFPRSGLQRFVAFQTAAGAGQRHRLGPELLATALRLAVRPGQPGQHRSRSCPSRADAVPFWKGLRP